MKILICFATTEGQTRKVAEYIADVLGYSKHFVAVIDVTAAVDVDPADFGAAILAGSVHMGRYQTALVRSISQWSDVLNSMPTAFVSVSLSAASDDPHVRSEIDECAQAMLHEAGWKPTIVHHAAGAFRFADYGFFRRWIARMLAVQLDKDADPLEDAEYTDWQAVKAFAEDFNAGLKD